MRRWEPDDICAVILLVGAIYLLATGIDAEVKSILTVAAGWLFGKRYAVMRGRRGE